MLAYYWFQLFFDLSFQELEYWGLTELDIEPCCWGHYNRFKENKETLAAIDDSFTFQMDPDAFGNKPTRYTEFKKRVWIFLEDPASSKGAKVKGDNVLRDFIWRSHNQNSFNCFDN